MLGSDLLKITYEGDDIYSPPRGNSSEGYSIITGALPPVTSINATWAATYAVPADEQEDFVMQDLRGQVCDVSSLWYIFI